MKPLRTKEVLLDFVGYAPLGWALFECVQALIGNLFLLDPEFRRASTSPFSLVLAALVTFAHLERRWILLNSALRRLGIPDRYRGSLGILGMLILIPIYLLCTRP